MSGNFQRRSRVRKVIYAVLILALFSLSLVYRPYVLEAQADSLALREQNQGEVDPLGAAVRLSLTGSRGVALCWLWHQAIEKQARHEWNKLDLLIKSITQLQPHFITPWLFQSWNLAYNVSVESDRIRDKYFYISKGLELLAEGERQNRNHPDLRFNIGYYYLDKIGMADQQRTLRTLLQLSCIDPLERDPARMRLPDGKVDLLKFQAFCEKYPHVARRLREMQNLRTPEQVLQFLAEHYEIPSRYEKPIPGVLAGKSKLKPPEKQFPFLPRPEDIRRDQALYGHGFRYEYPADDVFPPDFDNYLAAQVWFIYAQEPLPDPSGTPGPLSTNFDRTRYRLPRQPAVAIFRGYPAIAQTRFAEQLQREGWFDRGWEIDAGLTGRDRWFPEKVTVGQHTWSTAAWSKALRMWREHGTRTGVFLSPEQLQPLQEQAKLYRETYGVGPLELDPKLRADDFTGEMRQSFEAHYQLVWYEKNRQLGNFPHFLAQAEGESDPDAIAARELFFQAIRRRKADAPADEVRRLYEEAFPKWLGVLNRYPDFRADLDVQELNYRLQYRYLDVVLEKQDSALRRVLRLQDHLEQRRTSLKQLLLLPDFLGQGAVRATPWMPPFHLLAPGNLFERPKGPFDGLAPDGKPYISPLAVQRGKSRLDLDEMH
jgi:hypothetical protein